MKSRIRIVVAVVIIGVLGIVVSQQRDVRLVGTFAPDANATHDRWSLGKSITVSGISNVLNQIYHSAPIIMTDRTMTMTTAHGVVKRRYVVIWKGTRSSIIAMSRLTFFTVEFAKDGAWFKLWPLWPSEYTPMIVKMKRADAPTTAPSLREPADGSRS